MLGTANLNSIPQPQIPQNCKRCSATANPQVCDRFAVTFRTSATATANAHCSSANLGRNFYCYFVLMMIFSFLEVKSPKKKVINARRLTSNPEEKSVHFFHAVLPRNRQHWLLLCGFAVNFSFFTANPQILAVRNLVRKSTNKNGSPQFADLRTDLRKCPPLLL